MSPLRLALVGGGLLIAGGAIFLLIQGLSGGDPAPAAAEAAAPGAPASGKGAKDKDGEVPPPAWQSFLRPDDPARAIPRPLARLEVPAGSPFVPQEAAPAPPATPAHPAYGEAGREPLFREAARAPARPLLRLEGVAAGPPRLALISGKVVRPGDTIHGYRVLRVGTRDVALQSPGGGRLELVLGATAGSGS